MAGASTDETSLESREPSVEDLAGLCRDLNELGAHYMILGGFALRAAGYERRTMDIDILVEATLENEAKVIEALSRLPDGAASELVPGDIEKYGVIRVADEIVVDLMHSASGFSYVDASPEVAYHQISDVRIPFASPGLLLKMKGHSVRDKDRADAAFLRRLLALG